MGENILEFSGPFDNNIFIRVFLNKDNKNTIIKIPSILQKCNNQKNCMIQSITPLKKEFRPSYNINSSVFIVNNSNDNLGSLIIDTDGIINIYTDESKGLFSKGEGIYGIYECEITY